MKTEMASYYYADINEKGQVCGVKMLSGPIECSMSVEIPEELRGQELLGWYYIDNNFMPPEYFAVLDGHSVVVEVTTIPKGHEIPRGRKNLIPIQPSDAGIVGQKYTDGKFVPPPSEIEMLRKELASYRAENSEIKELLNYVADNLKQSRG